MPADILETEPPCGDVSSNGNADEIRLDLECLKSSGLNEVTLALVATFA